MKYIVEFIGTFFLVLVIGLAGVLGEADVLAPIAIGAMLMIMVYAGGHISGAHYNPAVTLGVSIRGALDSRDSIVGYILAQIIGAVLGAVLSVKVIGAGAEIETVSPDVFPSLVAEFLFTFALVWTVLNVAASKSTEGNSFYGLAIGSVVMVGAFSVGSISLGAFNPAVAIGLIVMGKLSAASIWIYLLANFGAAVLAALVYNKVVSPIANKKAAG